ncbi:MAG: single-stranded DNA-binding protein [Planctomycetes bacterium]|jgi:single-strand DNA-binding protein|nr:single-stranded DNA-binding protein [Planctomycetota bacterium]
MANLNKVLLMGNLTRDPQLSYLPSQTAVVEFGLAVNRRYKKQDGTMADEPCFVDCRMFGKRAETINRYFKKGEPIFVEGRLQYDQWQAPDGSRKSRLRVFVENFEFIGRAGGGQNARSGGFGGAPAPEGPDMTGGDIDMPYGAGGDDDIPF